MYRLKDILDSDAGCSSCGRSKRLYEAYSDKAIQQFLDKFKDEADDLNIDVTDSQLKAYIKTFDKTKEKLDKDKRDLAQWKVADLIRFATSGKSEEPEEGSEIDITPDVVYHSDDDKIAIYKGSSEENCVKYGKGENWCITKSSFPNYRFSAARNYPTFYLAKNNNLPKSDKLSFVAIQVRDPKKTDSNERYVYTNRKNDPNESNSMGINQLKAEIPWLKEIPNVESILKYIPLTPEETATHKYKDQPATYREWAKLPFRVKQQYLKAREEARQNAYRTSDKDLFTDISDDEFISKYLSKYPDVLDFVARNAGVIEPNLLIKNLKDLPDSARRSITANIREPLDNKYLSATTIPFDIKKLFVKLNKWKVGPDQRLYVTKDGGTIVKLDLGNELKMGLYQAEDDFPSVKINKRTSKYLLDNPELDKIPLSLLVDLSEKDVLDPSIAKKVIDDAKKDPNSAIKVKETEDGDVVLDSNSLATYKVQDGKLVSIPFQDEKVQSIFKDKEESEEFKKNTLKVIPKAYENLPSTVNTAALRSIIDSMPYDERHIEITRGYTNDQVKAIAFTDDATNSIFLMKPIPTTGDDILKTLREYVGTKVNGYRDLEATQLAKYFDYLRTKNFTINDTLLQSIAKRTQAEDGLINAFMNSNPPLSDYNSYVPVVDEGTLYLVNKRNRRDSLKMSPASGRLVNAILSQGRYNQLLGTQPEPAAAPAQQQPAAAQQQQQPARTYYQQPAPVGDVNIQQTMTGLGAGTQFAMIPNNDRRRLNITNGAALDITRDGGARRRNQLLGNAGRVTNGYAALTSRIYVIRLANGTNVISIKVYPGNREYLLIPGQTALQLNEPNELLRVLRQRNLAEIRKYLINSFIDANPGRLDELKQLLRNNSIK
jgi:hypothetical protein